MGDMKANPALITGFSMIMSAMIMIVLVVPGPLGQEDKDGDGISDIFQKIEKQSDLVYSSAGEWKEVDIGYRSSTDIPFSIFIGSLLFVMIPFAIYFLSIDGPKREELMRKKRAASAMHDNLRRLSSFMSINPSIPNAIRLSHVSQFGEGEKVLGQVLWTSRTSGITVENSLKDVTGKLAGDDPVLLSAIEGLISAQGEGTREEVLRSSESVVEMMSKDIRDRMGSYSRSLKAPATLLFGLGVLLPVLLATMIPIAGLSMKTVLMIGAILWILIPIMMVRISTSLVLKRPLVSKNNETTSRKLDLSLATLPLTVAGFIFVLLSISFISGVIGPTVLVDGPFPGTDSTIILLLLMGISMITASIFSILSKTMKREGIKFDRKREKVPDLLSEIGAHLMEGRSIERAIAKGYDRIGERAPLQGRSNLEDGKDHYRPFLQVASDFSRAGGRTGGRAVKALSRHLKEMDRLENSMKEMVRSSVGQMEITSSVFAPVMIGASVGIFRLMDSTAPLVEGGQMIGNSVSTGDLSVSGFILLSGIYLLLLSVSTSLSLHRLEEGKIKGGGGRIPRNILLSSVMFTAGVVMSTLALGG